MHARSTKGADQLQMCDKWQPLMQRAMVMAITVIPVITVGMTPTTVAEAVAALPSLGAAWLGCGRIMPRGRMLWGGSVGGVASEGEMNSELAVGTALTCTWGAQAWSHGFSLRPQNSCGCTAGSTSKWGLCRFCVEEWPEGEVRGQSWPRAVPGPGRVTFFRVKLHKALVDSSGLWHLPLHP